MSDLTARTADKYDLYTKSCQDVDAEISFVQRIGRFFSKKAPLILREDFCGTAQIATQWVKADRSYSAIAVDSDPEPIAWWYKHLHPTLDGEQAERISMLRADVRDLNSEHIDCILALNHSYMVFKTRDQLLDYFKVCCESLSSKGFLILDLYGGYHARFPGVAFLNTGAGWKAIWRQSEFNPVTNQVSNRLDFSFSDGSQLPGAFTYRWRLWSTAELRDVLQDAGFANVLVFDKRFEVTNTKSPNRLDSHTSYDDFEFYIVAVTH